MTDSNYRNRDYGARSSQENDPLMELSRIIGFDEPVRQVASRDETEDFSFDLEQELAGAVEAELHSQPQPVQHASRPQYQPAGQQGWSAPRQLASARDFSTAPQASYSPRATERSQAHQVEPDFSTSLENELNLSLDDDHDLPGDFSLDAPFATSLHGEGEVEDLTIYDTAYEDEEPAFEPAYVAAPSLEDELGMMLSSVPAPAVRSHSQASAEVTPRYPFHPAPGQFTSRAPQAIAHPEPAVETASDGCDDDNTQLDEDFFAEDGAPQYEEAQPVKAASYAAHPSYRYTSSAPAPEVETVTVAESRVEQTDTLDLPEVEYDPEPVSNHGMSALESEFAEVFTSIEVDEQPDAKASSDRAFDDIFNNAYETYGAGVAAQGTQQQAGYQSYQADAQASGTAGDYYNHWANSGADTQGYDQQAADDLGIPAAANENRAGRGRRGLMLASVTGAALLIGGLGYYGLSSGGGTGAPVVIAADSQPTKVQPANPGGNAVPNQDKVVYDQVAGTTSDAPKQKALVSNEEKPVDIANSEDDGDNADDTAVNDRVEPSMLETTVANGSGSEANPAFAPRRVQTMIVRPDGTIVQQEAAPAAPDSNDIATPRTRPAGAQVAGLTDTAGPEAGVNGATGDETGAIPPREVQTRQTPAAPVNTQTSANAPARVVKTQTITQDTAAVAPKPRNAPVVPSRPAEQPVRIVGSTVKTPAAPQPNTQVASAAGAATTAAASAGGYAIQIASTPTPEDAKKSYANLSRKFAGVIGGRGVDIRRADVPGKGTFYRVRVNAGSKENALALCTKYKAAGGSCFVTQ